MAQLVDKLPENMRTYWKRERPIDIAVDISRFQSSVQEPTKHLDAAALTRSSCSGGFWWPCGGWLLEHHRHPRCVCMHMQLGEGVGWVASTPGSTPPPLRRAPRLL